MACSECDNGWVWVTYDGKRVKERCPLCSS